MEHMEYKVEISAPAKTVWNTMLQEKTYKQWAGKTWSGSYYEGRWAKGEKIKFMGPDKSGTLAEIVDVKPYESIFMRHVAALDKGKEDKTSQTAKGWIGSTEGYKFEERDGNTILTVSIETHPEWRKMFDDTWPGGLQELKRLTEHQLASV